MAKTNKERLIDLINRNNPLLTPPFDTSNIDFKDPIPDIQADWNTRITMIGLVDHGYKNETEIYYTRVNLNELGDRVQLLTPTALTPAALLEELNFIKGTSFIPEDFESLPALPDLSYSEVTLYELVAHPLNLAWIGKLSLDLGLMISDDLINRLHHYLHVTLPLREASY